MPNLAWCPDFMVYLSRLNDVSNFKKGIDMVVKYRDDIVPYYPPYKDQIRKEMIKIKEAKEKKKGQGQLVDKMDAQISYINEILNK